MSIRAGNGDASQETGGFRITRSDHDERTSIVQVQGELDLATAPELKWTLSDVIDGGRRQIVLDLMRLDFIDSTAIGVLVGATRRGGDRVTLLIASDRPTVLQVFEVSGLDSGFPIYPSTEEALAAFEGPDA